MAQWPPLMRGHPFWEATFTQHLGWLLVRGFTVYRSCEKNFALMKIHIQETEPLSSTQGMAVRSQPLWEDSNIFELAKDLLYLYLMDKTFGVYLKINFLDAGD